MGSRLSNTSIFSLPCTLTQLALTDKQTPAPASFNVLSKASNMPQTYAVAADDSENIQNVGQKDSHKLTTKLQENKQQRPQKPPRAVRSKESMQVTRYVGFANLPNQMYYKAVKRGFEFTLMVVGASGLGKSTLINSMFLTDIYNDEQYPGPSLRQKKTVAVEATTVLLRENGVNLKLTVVDTPGFGDSVDNTNCWLPILEYIDSKYEEYLTAESRVIRKKFADNRVHCCLYFIAPSGHGLRPLDIACMRALCEKVNLVPIIAKADTLTRSEVHLFKRKILNEIAQHNIKIFYFPATLEDAAETSTTTQNLRSCVPFAVVGANSVIELADGKKVRGRKYPWGSVEVENPLHCDFVALRNMIIRIHLQDLKDFTNNVHYENYRRQKFYTLGTFTHKNPLIQMEEEKFKHELRMIKMKAEMDQVFDMKVKVKLQKFKDCELEYARRQEECKKALELEMQELEEKRHEFERERNEWENLQNISTLEKLKHHSLVAKSSFNSVDY